MLADKLTAEQYESNCGGAEVQNKTGWYNMKVFQYENGITEIRTYSEVVGRKPCNLPEEILVAKQKVARIRNQLKERTVFNPFCDAEMGLYDLDEMELDAKRKAHSRANSYSRTIQQIYSVSRQCEWEYFITLTFSPEVVDRYDYRACMKKARKWFDNQKQRRAQDMQYLIVPEEHKDGAWHIHGLIARCDGISLVDSGHKHSGRTVYNMDGWKYGFTDCVAVDDVHKISNYVTKYITKSVFDRTAGLRRYYKSNNIPPVRSYEFMVEGNEKEVFAKMLADSIGCEETYSKEIGGYTAVKYQYFKSEVKNNER